MQNGAYNRPIFPNAPAMNGGSGYGNYALSPGPYSPAASSMYSPVVPHSGPQLQAPVQDPDLLPSNARYGLSGTARQTPPSDALLNGFTANMTDGKLYTGENGARPGQGHQRKTSHLLDINDPVAMHLLVETALGDSGTYDVLSFDEVERLKKELTALDPRIESVRKRLALESKVRDAALSLNRLYRKNTESAPKSHRRSSGSAPKRNDRDSLNKTEDELASANKKCADLSKELYSLEMRQQKCQTKLLMHTAGVLQMTHKGPVAKRNLEEFHNVPEGMMNGMNGVNGGRPESPASIYTYENERLNRNAMRGDRDDFDERSLYRTPDEMYGFSFDGTSRTERAMTIQKDLGALGRRLEDLNTRLRGAISQINPSNDAVSPLEAPQAGDTATVESVTRQIDSIANNLDTFSATTSSIMEENNRQMELSVQQNQRKMYEALAQKDQQYELLLSQRNNEIEKHRTLATNVGLQLEEVKQRSAGMLDPAILPRIEFFNKQLYGLLNASAAAGVKQQETPPPPSYDERDPYAEIEYMENAIGALSRTYQNLLEIAEDSREREERDAADRGKAEQMETVLSGLWSIILAGEEDERQRRKAAGEEDDMPFDANERFSLPSFSKKVQWLIGQSSDLREQLIRSEEQYAAAKEELMEQLADMEKGKGEEVAQAHNLREEKERELAAIVGTSRGHETKVTELEQQLQAQTTEMKGMQDALEASRATTAERQNTLQTLRQQLTEKDAELKKLHDDKERELVALRDEDTKGSDTDKREIERLRGVNQDFNAEITRLEQALKDGSKSDKEEIERLENELVRLTTEVTLAKAELDASYGSRAERKAEADSETAKKLADAEARLASLQAESKGSSPREKELEDELKDTLKEFEELTRASVDAERERDKLEAAVDGLREKVEQTEAALGEEKVRWLGVKSPGEGGEGKSELTSVTTMRAEFKKMMRDTRLEGVKALRVSLLLLVFSTVILFPHGGVLTVGQAEQEERKKLEQQLKQLRREQQGVKQSGLRQMFSAATGY